MDMDGFMINRHNFLCKEISIIAMDNNNARHEALKLGAHYNDLTPTDKRTARYVSNNIHGMFFKDYGFEKYGQEDIPHIVKTFILSHENAFIAYKGGQEEKKILNKLGLRSINLEVLGCPKFDHLIKNPNFMKIEIDTNNCRLHRKIQNKTFHCSLLEVHVFKNWLQSYLQN